MKERKVVNRTRNAREFAAYLESKLNKKLRKMERNREREAKEMRLLLSTGR